MRAVIQRVSRASVAADGSPARSIGRGLVLLVGVEEGDTEADADVVADKTATLRVFADGEDHFAVSVSDVAGAVLVVSQFTLPADMRKGRRPSFSRAAAPDFARPLVDRVAARLAARGLHVATGVFGAIMQVDLVNDGPATFVLDVREGRVR